MQSANIQNAKGKLRSEAPDAMDGGWAAMFSLGRRRPRRIIQRRGHRCGIIQQVLKFITTP
jgi:hypothetical protein